MSKKPKKKKKKRNEIKLMENPTLIGENEVIYIYIYIEPLNDCNYQSIKIATIPSVRMDFSGEMDIT